MKKFITKLNKVKKEHNVKTLMCNCSCTCGSTPTAQIFDRYYQKIHTLTFTEGLQ